MAKFKIKQVFRLSFTNSVCVAGDFVSGVIHLGDILCLKKNKHTIVNIGSTLTRDGSLFTLMIDADKKEIEPFIGETVIILPTNGAPKKSKES